MYVSDGSELATHDLGGSGDDLVLMTHGAGLCAAMLSPMAEALSGNFYKVGLDLRGHGSSGRAVNRDYTWPRIGKDIREILDAVAAPLHIFGHSVGASAALLAALERPDSVRSLCLFEPIILDPTDTEGIEEMARSAEGRRAVFASRAEIVEHFSSRGFFKAFEREALAGYVDGAFRAQPDGRFELALAPEDEAAIFRESIAPGVWDGLGTLPDLDLEIAVLFGSSSTGPRAAGVARLAKLDPRVHVIEINGVGHFGPFESPDLIGEMVSSILRTSAA
jgi:pimeloyl-ACP methyl ester carboxylesterase